ncbi:hypothetical protein EU803_17845 [Loktanella sp. IMCC34160]|uniref:hypothetical protein n=1 Tax=Loktanella sp. IMCC34160 TaxID=2510646 RepID=UPI00101CAB43|nr:hypothetical protein [Loktanella sp. IMCC34160]RYG89337.1 hypothetical protein EU803_17845 [Loktanella sp. IMCC34160]
MFANPPPDLIKLYIRNVAIGFGLSAVFVALLLWFDIAGLGGLVARSDKGWIAVLMLFLSNGVIFAGVQFAFAVMSMAEDDDDDEPRGGRRAPVPEQVAIPVRVGSPAGS